MNISVCNTLAHEKKKLEICFYLKQLGKEFYTEAEFHQQKRADVYVTDDDLAIEVMHSEEFDSIAKKKKGYPCEVIAVKTTDRFSVNKLLELMI